MWLIVRVEDFKEQNTKEDLYEKYPDAIKDIYLPLCRKEHVDARGVKRLRFRPLLYGFLFVKVKSVSCLKQHINHKGYFVYKKDAAYGRTGNVNGQQTVSMRAHLLCSHVQGYDQQTIIARSTVDNEDMERFMFYSNRYADNIEGLAIVDKCYKDLIGEHDVVRVLNGPLEGWTGVVKQVKHKGVKDRRLFVSFGNDHCLSISDIRKYDLCIEHEARHGQRSAEVGVWRAIDQIIGHLQAQHPTESAPATLRALLKTYNLKQSVRRTAAMSDVAYARQCQEVEVRYQNKVLAQLDASMHSNFRILAKYFKADRSNIDEALCEFIPDHTLRPFLTPTAGSVMPTGTDHVVLTHNGIVELIWRCNLRALFSFAQYAPDRYAPPADVDYEYFAHFALLPTDGGRVRVVASWGDFYDHLASLTADEHDQLLADLVAKKYTNMHHLLTSTLWHGAKVPFPPKMSLSHTAGSISGFYHDTTVNYDLSHADCMATQVVAALKVPLPDAPSLSIFNALAAAAVEMWQGTRLLIWRQLLQRHVLLHKVPVAEMVTHYYNHY